MLLPAAAPAQTTASVFGRLVDSRGPVAGAEVRLIPPGALRRDSRYSRAVTTDSAGRFAFVALPPAQWLISARRVGYRPVQQFLRLGAEDTLFTLQITSVAQGLDTVRTVATGTMPPRYGPSSKMVTFYERQRRGRGVFFTREQLEATGHSALQPIFASVSGTRVRTDAIGRIFFDVPRCAHSDGVLRRSGTVEALATEQAGRKGTPSSIVFYVDGTRVHPMNVPDVLKEMTVDDVEAMEVYRGPSEIPAEVAGMPCAAVFIWRRMTMGTVLEDR